MKSTSLFEKIEFSSTFQSTQTTALVSCSSTRTAGAGARPDGRVITAQYFSDLSIRISEVDCGRIPSNLLYSKKFAWLTSLRKSICAMCFSDGGNVLIIATVDLCLYLVDVDSLCEAKAFSKDDDDLEEGLLFRSTRTTEGILSLSSIFSQISTPDMQLLSSKFCVEMPLGLQLKSDGGDFSNLEGETPTCVVCFCPATLVIRRLLLNREIQANGTEPNQSTISDNNFFSKCEGRFVLLGHTSGRVTVINISNSARHVVWSAVLDKGSPISSLNLFSDLTSLCEQGLWSLPREYIEHQEDPVVGGSDNEDNESSAESLEASIKGALFPTTINVPGCSVLICSRNHYFRLPLERSHPLPFAERRAAAEVAQALWSLTDGSRSNTSNSSQSSQDGGSNLRSRNIPSWAADLPEPRWTQTLFDITGVAAIAAFVQRSDLSDTLPSDQGTRPGTIRYFPVNPEDQKLPSTNAKDTLQQPSSSSSNSSHSAQRQFPTVFSTSVTTSTKAASAPLPPSKSRRRQSFAGMLGFAELETRKEKEEEAKQVLTSSRFPSLPVTFRMLPSEFRPVRLHQSPRRCLVSSEVSIRRKSSVVTVFYQSSDNKFLIFDPSLGDQPLFEMLLPSRSREEAAAQSHVFSSLKMSTDLTTSQLLPVNASFVAYADGIVFLGENILVDPQKKGNISKEEEIEDKEKNILSRDEGRSVGLLESRDTESVNQASNTESFVSAGDISIDAGDLSIDEDGSKVAPEVLPTVQNETTILRRSTLTSHRGRIHIISANLAQRSFRDVQTRLKQNTIDNILPSSSEAEPLLVPSDAILQTFDLTGGEVITGMKRVLLPLVSPESKPNATSVAVVISTSRSMFCLTGRDVNDGPSLIKRLVKIELSEDDSGTLSEITMSLLKRIAYINRLAFALGIVAADAVLALADDTCSALSTNIDLDEIPLQSYTNVKYESKVDTQEEGPLDFLSLETQSIRFGTLSRCKVVEQAFALYTIASAHPLRAVKALTSAGRPDLGVAYAAGALGEGSFESMAEENWRLFQQTNNPPGPLPTGSFASRHPSPAERTRLANLLIQCQLIAMRTTKLQERFQCRAFSQSAFSLWLAQSFDLQPEKAIPWLAASGYAYEALVVAHSRIASGKGLMTMALTAIANTGIDCLVENEPCLQFLGSNGYKSELFAFGGGLFLKALSPDCQVFFTKESDKSQTSKRQTTSQPFSLSMIYRLEDED